MDRGFNKVARTAEVMSEKDEHELSCLLNLLEKKQTVSGRNELRPYEIRTVGFERPTK